MNSNKKNKKITKDNFGSLLLESVQEGVNFVKGHKELKETIMNLPDAPPTFTPAKVKKIRSDLNISQPVFARLLGVSSGTVRSWEQGDKKPSGASARLLQIAQNDVNSLLKIA